MSLAAGLLSGLAPALQAGRDTLITSLRERGGTGFGGVRLRKAIVTLQMAFSLILVIGAALFVRTLTGLLAKGPGFDTVQPRLLRPRSAAERLFPRRRQPPDSPHSRRGPRLARRPLLGRCPLCRS